MTIIYLIRHSQQLRDTGIKKIDENDQITNEKIILSVEGEQKANELSELSELQNIDVIWSSNYVRAKQTAKYFAYKNNLNINIDSNFNERKLGKLFDLKKLVKEFEYPFTKEQLINNQLKNLDGESMQEVKERMTYAIENILKTYENKRIIIVSHGAAMKYYLMNYCQLNDEIELTYNNNILDFSSPSIIKLTFDGDKLIDIKNV